MRGPALFTLPLVFAMGLAAPAWAQANSFNNQTGNAQNASRLSGLHTDNGGVHQMNTGAANSYSGAVTAAPGAINPGPATETVNNNVPGAANSGAGGSNAGFPDRLTTATAPPSQGGALPLAGEQTPGSGAYGGTTSGSTPDSGASSPAAPR